MRLTPYFFSRHDRTQSLTLPFGVPSVERMGWKAIGGCSTATIRIHGDGARMQALLDWLGHGVEIRDQANSAQWWGIINSVRLVIGNVATTVSLDNISNRVAITYTNAGVSTTTTYLEDTGSSGNWGGKERIESMQKETETTEVTARQLRVLNEVKYPIASKEISGGDEGATLECIGYWQTLDWKNYTRAAETFTNFVLAGWNYATNQISLSAWANGSNSPVSIAQKFTTGSESLYASSVAMWLGGIGRPPSGFTYEIWSYASIVPTAGTKLANTNAFWCAEADWQTQILVSPLALTPSTDYWLLGRGGDRNFGTNLQWVVGVDPNLSGARCEEYGTGNWLDINTFGIPLFATQGALAYKINCQLDNASQIAAIVTSAGQFLTGTEIKDASGLTSSTYFDGNTTAQALIERLLENGSSNFRRMLAYITRERKMRIEEEPVGTRTSTTLFLNRNGQFVDAGNNLISYNPVARWCVDMSLTPPTGGLGDPGLFFVDECEYDTQSDAWTITTRGIRNVMEFAQPRNE